MNDTAALNDVDDHVSPSVRTIGVIYAAAILVRLALALTFGDHEPLIADAQDYDGLANRLCETGQYVSESGTLVSLRPPLYPAMLAVIYQLFGTGNYVAVSLVQGLISMLTMAATHQLGSRIGGPRVGLWSAAIIGFYPSLLAFNCLVLSETLFTFLFTMAVLATVRLQSSASVKWAVILGLCLGLGALTRSILWVCSIPIFGYLLLAMSDTLRQRFVSIAVAAGVFAVTLAPWAYRNTRLHETFTVVDVMGGRNVMMGNYEYTPLERSWATITDVGGDQAWNKVLFKSLDNSQGLTQGQIDKQAMRYGIRYFFANPGVSAKRCVVRFFNFWQLERTMIAGAKKGLWGSLPKVVFAGLALAIIGSYAAVLLFALIGLCSGNLPWKEQGLLLLWMALPCAIHTIAFAHSRYHLPLVPILATYASMTITGWMAARKNPAVPIRGWLPGVLLFVLFVLSWAREIVMVDLAKLGG